MTKEKSYQEILASIERQYPGKLLLSIKEVANIFNCSARTIYNGRKKGTKKPFPIAPTIGKKFSIISVAAYLAR